MGSREGLRWGSVPTPRAHFTWVLWGQNLHSVADAGWKFQSRYNRGSINELFRGCCAPEMPLCSLYSKTTLPMKDVHVCLELHAALRMLKNFQRPELT